MTCTKYGTWSVLQGCSTSRKYNNYLYLFWNQLVPDLIYERMSKPMICIGENKDEDQLCSNCEADQRLCFRHTDGTVPLLFIS